MKSRTLKVKSLSHRCQRWTDGRTWGPDETVTRLEMCTLWCTLKLKLGSSCHIAGGDVSRLLRGKPWLKEIVDSYSKGITNATVVAKTALVSKVIVIAPSDLIPLVETMFSSNDIDSHCCNNMFK
jgi:hypothetical protein